MFGGACSREFTAQDKVTAEWNAMAGEWDDVALGYAQGLYDLLVRENENIHLQQARCIVDFGCGTGLLTEQILMRRKTSSQRQQKSDIDNNELHILAIDPSTEMMDLLQDKILSCDWTTIVHPLCAALGELNNGDAKSETTKQVLEPWHGKVDLIVASNVLNYIPDDDLPATMQQLNRLLSPGGCLVHSDWPPHQYQQAQQPQASEAVTTAAGSDWNASHPQANLPRYPDGIMTEQRAKEMYAMVGWQPELMQIRPLKMGNKDDDDDDTAMIFLGIARKCV